MQLIFTCPNVATKTPEQRQWRRCRVFVVYFEQILCFFLVFLFVDFEPVNVCWVCLKLFTPLLQCLRNCHEGVFLHSSFWGFAKWREKDRPLSCKCPISMSPGNRKPEVKEISNSKVLKTLLGSSWNISRQTVTD